MRTRSQKAASGSPLHSLSQEEHLNGRPRARRANRKTTTKTTTTTTITESAEVTLEKAKAKAGRAGTRAVNGTASAETTSAETTTTTQAPAPAPEANHASPTAALASSTPSVIETPTKPPKSTKQSKPEPAKPTMKPTRATRASQPAAQVPTAESSSTSTNAQTSQSNNDAQASQSSSTAAHVAEDTSSKPKRKGKSKIAPMSETTTTTTRPRRTYPRSTETDDSNWPPTYTSTYRQNNRVAQTGAEEAETQQPLESEKPASPEKPAAKTQRRTRARSPRKPVASAPLEGRVERRPRQRPIKPLKSNLSGEELLQAIREARDEGRIAQYGTAAVDTPEDVDMSTEDTVQPQEPQPPQTPLATAAAHTDAPRSTGWGLRTLFTNFLPTLPALPTIIFGPGRQSNGVAQATASPTPQQDSSAQQNPSSQEKPIVLAQEHADAIGAGLVPPSPSPAEGSVRRAKSKPRARAKPTPKRRNSSQAAIVDYAMRDVHPAEEAIAIHWAEKTAEKIAKDKATLGSKRKQLEQPMKLKEVKEIPARRPWEPSGSYGLLPEFFEDSDSDEEAPGWYLVDQLAHEQPPMKKRKTSARSSDVEPATPPKMPLQVIDTNYNSASALDRRPRPSTIPSPMFDNPVTHHEGGNVFDELHTQGPITPARDREAFLKELRRTGHVEGSGAFCVPESDSDDDEESENDQENSLPWTQQPPPPPVPAHAQLPVPLDGSPSVPQFQRSQALDPVEAQRAKAMKHTPAKQSRLREVMLPSPSLNSDIGGSPLTRGSLSGHAPAFTDASSVRIWSEDELPDAIPVDLEGIEMPSDDPLGLRKLGLWEATMAATDSADFGGNEIALRDDFDGEMSEDDDEEL